ncbi:hypothetical protein PW52_04060 [Tamlana sedimentorum]|uniref:Uncharacterized protein n=1 Tax=Neotamlana sedimentorum TaxID=1435349 RepID=A0A0D7WCC8_9FLAO|nr:hypothetical protein [Tamlana sedimentorum]KJD36815.1 hypothetical protein PW52_04060 [Tamlana sedimentorum]
MKATKSLLMLFLIVATLYCSSSDDSDEMNIDLMSGFWSGTFSGDDTGTFSVFVYANGTVTGTAYSNSLKASLEIEGTIDEKGNLDAVLGSSDNGASFTGKFAKVTSSGTWNNPNFNISGTWSGTKD